MALWRFTLREVRSRPGRAILTLLSVVIGVTLVVAVNVAASTTRRAFADMYATVTGRAALEVTAEGGGSFDQQIVEVVAQTPGVETAVPLARRLAKLTVGIKGEKKPVQVTVLGVDLKKDQAVREYALIEGEPIESEYSLLVDSSFARNLKLKVHDKVAISSLAGRKTFTVVGLIAPRGASSVGLGVVYMALPVAQQRFNIEGQVDSVQIVVTPAADVAEVQAAVTANLDEVARKLQKKVDDIEAEIKKLDEKAARLTAQPDEAAAAQLQEQREQLDRKLALATRTLQHRKGLVVRPPATRTQMAEETMLSSQHGLLMATVFSLLLAGLIVFNTFQMNVVERRRQLSIMRAIGATRGQIMWQICRESLVMGVMGTVLGIGLGLGGAALLSLAMAKLLQTGIPPLQVTLAPILWAAVLGPAVSLLGALVPAWRAGRLSPLEGMGAVLPADLEAPPWTIAAIGAAKFVIGGAILLGCIYGPVPVPYSVIALLAMLIGLVLLVPIALGPLTRCVSWVLSPLLGVEGRLAEGQIVRRRGRTTLTVGVLFLALGFSVGLSSTITDNVNDVRHWYRQTLVGDFFVRAMMPSMDSGMAADMPAGLGTELRAIPGIANVEAVRFTSGEVGDQHVIIVVGEYQGREGRQLNLVNGDQNRVREQLAAGDVVVGTVLAQRLGLHEGSTIPLDTREGRKSIRVAGVSNEYLAGGLTVHMEAQVARRLLGIEGVSAYVVKAETGRIREVEQALQVLCDKHDMMLQSYADLVGIIESMMGGAVACLWLVLTIVLVVSAFGVVNTLTMNVIEQTRELGLLRIVAMTRRQVRKLIVAQAVLLATIGLVPGVLAGLALAYLTNLAMQPVIAHPIAFSLHALSLAACFFGAFLLVLAAAWLPAERAARLKLAEALQYQ